MKITRRSIITGTVRIMDLPITQKQVDEYERGVDIKICMPQLSQTDRMFFVSGITDDDFDESTVSVGHRLDK